MTANSFEKVVLYHRIADRECASLRKAIVERGYSDKIQFRNIDASEEARKKLHDQFQKDVVPAAEWRGAWHQGESSILSLLSSL